MLCVLIVLVWKRRIANRQTSSCPAITARTASPSADLPARRSHCLQSKPDRRGIVAWFDLNQVTSSTGL